MHNSFQYLSGCLIGYRLFSPHPVPTPPPVSSRSLCHLSIHSHKASHHPPCCPSLRFCNSSYVSSPNSTFNIRSIFQYSLFQSCVRSYSVSREMHRNPLPSSFKKLLVLFNCLLVRHQVWTPYVRTSSIHILNCYSLVMLMGNF